MANKLVVGDKMFRYIDGIEKPEVLRITRLEESIDKVRLVDSSGKKKSMSISELTSEYTVLRPDGMISICIADVDGQNDVMVVLSNIRTSVPTVNVVCRQLIYDFFTNNMKKSEAINYVGVSVRRDTCPANIEFESVLACNGASESRFLAIYLDDTLDDILKLFNNKKYDNALNKLYNNPPYSDGKITYGLNNSLRNLLINNNFMYDFRKTFNVYEIPYEVNIESESLSTENIKEIEKELKVKITETYVIEYSREIDTSKFNRNWILVTSAAEQYKKVYIVGYDVLDEDYIEK